MGTSGTNADAYGMVKRHLHGEKSQNSTWSPGGFTCEYVQMHMNRQKKNAKNKQTALGKKRTPNIIKPQHVENHWQH